MSDEQDKFEGFPDIDGNFTQVPNIAFRIMHKLSGAEYKCLLYIIRHTYGFREATKTITLDEFQNGRKSKKHEGGRMDNGTGLSKPAVIAALQSLVGMGYLLVEKDDTDKARKERTYGVNRMSKNITSEVNKVDIGGKENIHRTEKETLETNQEKETSVDANASTSGDSFNSSLPKQKAPKKAKTKTVIPRSELSEPDALYETVERQLFDTESLPDAPYLWDMPIGQITRWLKGEIEKVRGAVVGKISAPAKPNHIALFTAWYRGKYSDAAYPQEFSKFVKHWRAFASEQNRVRTALESRKQREAATEPIVDEPPMTDEERQRILERGRAMLNGRVKRD